MADLAQLRNIVLNVLGPLGDVSLQASSIVVGNVIIPEPKTGFLVVLGLASIVGVRHGRTGSSSA